MTRWRAQTRPLQRALQLIALSAFAVAQPLFDLLGRSAPFFVAHRAGPGTVLAFTVVAIAGPAVVLFGVSSAFFVASERAGRLAHATCVALMAALGLGAALVRMTGMGTRIALVAFALLVALAGLAYLRSRPFRAMLTLASPVALVVAGMFVVGSPVRHLVFPATFAPAAASERAGIQSGAPSGATPPVFVLLFDELSSGSLMRPDGSIDAQRYPSFARLAAGSTWYRDATTVATGTVHAVPSLLTGAHPTERTVPSHSRYPQNLFTLLSLTHDLRVSEFVTQLCPPGFCPSEEDEGGSFAELLGDAWLVYLHIISPEDAARRFLPPLGEQWRSFGHQDPLEDEEAPPTDPGEQRDWLHQALGERHEHEGNKTRDFLRGVRREARAKPALWYLHLRLPHAPWRYLPTGQVYPTWGTRVPGFTAENRFIDDPFPATATLQRSLVQTKYADAVLGEVLDHLSETGLYDETLLVVTSDHGASWEPGRGKREIEGAAADSTLWVPLLIKYPYQQEGVVDDTNTEFVDVLPTIARTVGVEIGWTVDGRSLLDGQPASAKRIFTARGHVIEMEPDPQAPARWAAEIERLFGPPGSPDDLYGFGPERVLVGRAVQSFRRSGSAGTVEILGGISMFADVDPEGPVLPAYLRGTLRGAERGRTLAVALNGRIAGVGRTYIEHDEAEMAVLLSPRHFVEGPNVLEVFLVEGNSLRPLAVQDPS